MLKHLYKKFSSVTTLTDIINFVQSLQSFGRLHKLGGDYHQKFFISLLVLGLTDSQVCADNLTNNENKFRFIQQDNYIIIKVFEDPPLYLKDQREKAFIILNPYIRKNTQKASVIWQKDFFSYGKSASVPQTYIKAYLDKKIQTRRFITLFTLQEVEPEPLYIKSPINYNNIPDELLLKITNLLEKAEVYRLSNENDSAKRIYCQILEINPNNVLALYRLGEIYKTEKDFSKAEIFYQKVLEVEPSFWAANKALKELAPGG